MCKETNYDPLPSPVPISEQSWSAGVKPLLTTRTMTFNHEGYIRQCLDGILSQKTTFPVEVLIHEDVSTDGTPDILNEYQTRYPNMVKVFYQKENTFNKPDKLELRKPFFEMIQGKYIALCEGDDYWNDPMKLQKQVSFLENNPDYSGCFHNTLQLKEEKFNRWREYDRLDFSAVDTFSKTALFHTSSFLFRADSYEIPHWQRHVMSGDMALFSIVASKGMLRRIPDEMSVYRKHQGGITTSLTEKNFHRNRIELMNYLNDYHNCKYEYKAKEIIAWHKSKLLKIENNEVVNPFYSRLISKIKDYLLR